LKIAQAGDGWQAKIIEKILLKRAGRNGRIWAVLGPKTGKTGQNRPFLAYFRQKRAFWGRFGAFLNKISPKR